MTRLTTLKISLFSALATLFLLVAMLASTGTASAHTASNQTTAFPHPQIEVTDVMPMGGNCEEINLVGFGFFPGRVHLVAFQQGYAFEQGYSVSVQPAFFKTNGSFSRDVTICGDFGWDYGLGWGHGFGWSHHHGWGHGFGWGYAPTVLIAIGPLGLQSNPVFPQSGEPIYIRR